MGRTFQARGNSQGKDSETEVCMTLDTSDKLQESQCG